MIDPNNFGIIEMLFFACVALGWCVWQLWIYRDAGKPKALPEDARHPEREHRADDGGS